MKKTIVKGCDHAGYGVKEFIRLLLQKLNCPVVDVGTHGRESVDYPDYAERVARMVKERRNIKGILACVTGIGASIAANNVAGTDDA